MAKDIRATVRTSEGEAELDSPEGRALLEKSVSRTLELAGRLYLASPLSEGYMRVLKLAVDTYAKKCVTVAKGLAEIGASDLQVNSLQNLVNAGYLALVNRTGEDAATLSLMSFPQRDAVRNALSYLHGEYEKVMEKEGALFIDTSSTSENIGIVQALFTALLPQKELGER
jgi:hypothetical protein